MHTGKFDMLPDALMQRLPDQHVVKISVPRAGFDVLVFEAPIRLISRSCIEVHPPAVVADDPALARAGLWTLCWQRGETVVTIAGRREPGPDPGRVLVSIDEISFQPSKRRYPRVEAEVDLRYWPIDWVGKPARWALARTVNISGCGIRFLAGDDHPVGRQLGLELCFPGGSWPAVNYVGQIVYREAAPSGGFWLTLEVVSMTRPNLDVLVQFCLARQFKQLQAKVRNLGSILDPVAAPPEDLG
jgi:hypothetical protein